MTAPTNPEASRPKPDNPPAGDSGVTPPEREANARAMDSQRIAAVLALTPRPWDENDADSAEARSARAYNHALATCKRILTEPPWSV